MFIKKDPNAITKCYELKSSGKVIGQLIAEYHIIKYSQVQVEDYSSVNKKKNQKFLVHCTQRIIIGNSLNSFSEDSPESFDNYPVLFDISNKFNVTQQNKNGFKIDLLDYSPKTINTQIQATGTIGNSDGASTSNSKTNTTGSSTSETNSFGTSVSVGSHISFSDIGGSTNVTTNQEHSSTTTNEQSISNSSDFTRNKNQELSASVSMSIKDWGAYAYLDKETKNQGWIFGQEYPWNSINCRSYKPGNNHHPNNETQKELFIPKNMQACLFDGESLSPPSQLSLYGLNFVMKSLYLITLDNNFSDKITIDHDIYLYTASHLVSSKENKKEAVVYLDKQPTQINVDAASMLNLQIMALEVLGLPNKPAIIGFIPNKFIVSPKPITKNNLSSFRIISSTNTLYIEDTTDYSNIKDNEKGFEATKTSLIANLSKECNSLSFKAYFKIVDVIHDYNLYLKHWKRKGSQTIKLTITINNDEDSTIIKYVEAEEATGGEKNLLTIALRDQSYASIDHIDYLQLGLNSIEIKIEPSEEAYDNNCGYHIRAISIE